VIEVDRPNRQVRRRHGKSDPLDAVEAARAALSGRANGIAKTADGYRMTGTVEIHGKSRPHSVDLEVQDRGENWAMSTQTTLTQSDFGVKPYSLLMGAVKVADPVTISFTASHPK
jgi:polyisoprenoid-binding protein YceI